ncbi:eukaryotic translation initiation factor 5B isoform X2 [Capsella rubella]|nr:eukaryotic translation initiation factor 5B isoform X2 [Capsella rubella]
MQQDAITSLIPCLSKPGEGVYVTASTIISLKTVVERLTAPFPQLNNIPVSALGLGPVTTGDIFKAHKLFLEGGTGNPLFATVLAFSVPLTRNASKLAETLGVKVISSAISVDHLHRQFEEYTNELRMEKQKTEAHDSAFSPCVLCILPKCVLNKEDPIVVGVYVLEGSVSVGTPLCVPNRAFINVGRVAWIEKDQQPVEDARQGEKVIIKIVSADPRTKQLMLGREFDVGDVLVSRLSKRSIYHFIIPS